jgi:hypothetical protein
MAMSACDRTVVVDQDLLKSSLTSVFPSLSASSPDVRRHAWVYAEAIIRLHKHRSQGQILDLDVTLKPTG